MNNTDIGAPWDIEFTDEFELWWNSLDADEQESIARGVLRIRDAGASVPFPHSSKIRQSRFGAMRELRIQH